MQAAAPVRRGDIQSAAAWPADGQWVRPRSRPALRHKVTAMDTDERLQADSFHRGLTCWLPAAGTPRNSSSSSGSGDGGSESPVWARGFLAAWAAPAACWSRPGSARCGGIGSAAGRGTPAPGSLANAAVAATWTLPGGNLQETRDGASAINSSNVARLGQSRAACLSQAPGCLAGGRVPLVEERVYQAVEGLRLLGEAEVRGVLDDLQL